MIEKQMHPVPNLSAATSRSRLEALDGLRGLAALMVFAHHALVLMYGALAGINPQHLPLPSTFALTLLQRIPVAWMFNGTFAVSFFFVLSGFVLTRSMGKDPAPERVARLVTLRFLRLLPLVALGTCVGYLTFEVAVVQLDRLASFCGNGSATFINASLLQDHSFWVACKQAMFVIWRGTQAEYLLDPPLWSIGVELKGSLIVYLLMGVFVGTARAYAKYWVGLALGLCMVGPSSMSFLAGMYLAERSRDRKDVILAAPKPVLSGLAFAALCWASVHPWNRHLWLPLFFSPPEILDTTLSTLSSVFLMAAGLQISCFREVLSSRPVQYLGHASYGLYIVHVPLLYVGTAPLLAILAPVLGLNLSCLVAAATILGIALLAGGLLISYVDGPIARWSKHWVIRWLQTPRAL